MVLQRTMSFVIMMHECSPREKTAFMHHAVPSAVYQPQKVGLLHECTSGMSRLASPACMLHDDKGNRTLKHFAALKGLLNQDLPEKLVPQRAVVVDTAVAGAAWCQKAALTAARPPPPGPAVTPPPLVSLCGTKHNTHELLTYLL